MKKTVKNCHFGGLWVGPQAAISKKHTRRSHLSLSEGLSLGPQGLVWHTTQADTAQRWPTLAGQPVAGPRGGGKSV